MRCSNSLWHFLRKIMPFLLCACLVLGMAGCARESAVVSYDTPREWSPVYNLHQHESFMSMASPVAFQENLTEEDLENILPEKPLPFNVDKATVRFKEDRTVYEVVLYIGSRESYTAVVFGDGSRYNFCCSFLKKGENKSPCGKVEYTLYQVDDDLIAETEIMGVNIVARTFGTMSKQDFEAILECFSWYSSGYPRIYRISPKEH